MAMYTELKIGTELYRLRLGAQNIVDTEKKLGSSILTVLMSMGEGNQIVELEKALIILHGSMQKYNHGITMEQVYDLYDEFIDDGGNFIELVEKLVDVLTVSGFFNKTQMEEMKKVQEKTKIKK